MLPTIQVELAACQPKLEALYGTGARTTSLKECGPSAASHCFRAIKATPSRAFGSVPNGIGVESPIARRLRLAAQLLQSLTGAPLQAALPRTWIGALLRAERQPGTDLRCGGNTLEFVGRLWLGAEEPAPNSRCTRSRSTCHPGAEGNCPYLGGMETTWANRLASRCYPAAVAILSLAAGEQRSYRLGRKATANTCA